MPSAQPPSQTPSLQVNPSLATANPSNAFSQPVVDASTLLDILQKEQLGAGSDVLYEVISHLLNLHYFAFSHINRH